MKKLFVNAKTVGNDCIKNDALLVEDGKIVSFLSEFKKSDFDEVIDCKGNYLFPGFIDIHVHGGGGADFSDATVTSFEEAVETHLKHGTTTIFPTTMSVSIERLSKIFGIYRDFKKTFPFADTVKGLHLEGPFLNPTMCGAQRKDLIIEPTEKETDFLKDNADIIARITCAPEVNDVIDMAKKLLPLGISFSMGHTAATYEQAEDAFNNGFTSITHLYSATSGFHKVNQKVHIGVTQAAYGLENIYAELIADGCHVPKELLRLVAKIKGINKVCLVTDAMRAAGTFATESYLGEIAPENRVIIEDGVAKLPDRSFFAGSIGTMDRAVRFAINCGFTPCEVSQMTSLTPATLMGIEKEKGSLEVGKDADIVVLDKEFTVKQVYLKGKGVLS